MPILNYTTSIDAHKTIGEIQQILSKINAKKISIDYVDQLPVALTFALMYQTGNVESWRMIPFCLPCNYKKILLVLERDRKVPAGLRTKEQALKVAWRILKDWVQAQTAIIQAEMVTADQVFLPYAVTKDGKTLYEYVTENSQLLLN